MRTMLFTLVLLMVAGTAMAGVTQYADRATFEAQGVILENWNFSDWGGCWCYPGEPYSTHGVTYTPGSDGQNLIGEQANTGYPGTLIMNNYWTPMWCTVDLADIDMVAWEGVGVFSGGVTTITVHTTVGDYVFNVAYPAPPGDVFVGFIADVGEVIMGWDLDGEAGVNGPGSTNVTLGQQNLTAIQDTSWSSMKSLY